MKIDQQAVIVSESGQVFGDRLASSIDGMQEDGLEVEIQFHPFLSANNRTILSALVLGRKKDEK